MGNYGTRVRPRNRPPSESPDFTQTCNIKCRLYASRLFMRSSKGCVPPRSRRVINDNCKCPPRPWCLSRTTRRCNKTISYRAKTIRSSTRSTVCLWTTDRWRASGKNSHSKELIQQLFSMNALLTNMTIFRENAFVHLFSCTCMQENKAAGNVSPVNTTPIFAVFSSLIPRREIVKDTLTSVSHC